jgi:hypothetical protein
MKNKINWRSNTTEYAAFFQMIGEISQTDKYFITKMKGDEKYALHLSNKIRTTPMFFQTIELAQSWCQEHANNKTITINYV